MSIVSINYIDDQPKETSGKLEIAPFEPTDGVDSISNRDVTVPEQMAVIGADAVIKVRSESAEIGLIEDYQTVGLDPILESKNC